MDDGTCSVEACDLPRRVKGMCRAHYCRWWRTGDPLPQPPTDDLERFYGRVDQAGPSAKNRPDLGRCWTWTSRLDDKGYGLFSVGGKVRKAHRWIWESVNGPVPEGLELDHFACDNRRCANPGHVRPVTHLENMARGAHAAKTHCPAGHPYDKANTAIYDGRRNCKACRAKRLRRWRARNT